MTQMPATGDALPGKALLRTTALASLVLAFAADWPAVGPIGAAVPHPPLSTRITQALHAPDPEKALVAFAKELKAEGGQSIRDVCIV